jgi:hypothetical protein
VDLVRYRPCNVVERAITRLKQDRPIRQPLRHSVDDAAVRVGSSV